MEDDARSKILKHLSEMQVAEIARVCNRFPSVNLKYTLDNKTYEAGE